MILVNQFIKKSITQGLIVMTFSTFIYFAHANNCHKAFGRLGTSINQGQVYKGVAKANLYLEKKGFWKTIQSVDFGDIPIKDSKDFTIYEDLFHKTLKIIEKNYRPALIGGDHSQSFSTISALLKHYPHLKVVWVDAHTDINTRYTSSSNNIHGMPVAGLMGFMEKESWNESWLISKLPPENIIYMGIRDMDSGEKRIIKKYNIENYSAKVIKTKGIKTILPQIVKKWKGEPIHLSFDIDGLDRTLVPATGTPVSDGISLNDGLEIIEAFRSDLVSFELTEFNPDLAKSQKDLETTQKTVETLLKLLFSPIEKVKPRPTFKVQK